MYYELVDESEFGVTIRFTDTESWDMQSRRLWYNRGGVVFHKDRVMVYCFAMPQFSMSTAPYQDCKVFLPGGVESADGDTVSIPWSHWPRVKNVLKEACWIVSKGVSPTEA